VTDCTIQRQFRETPQYQETLLPVGLRYQTVVTFEIPGKIVGMTVIRDRDFTDKEAILLHLLAPRSRRPIATPPKISGYPSYLIENGKAVDSPVIVTQNLANPSIPHTPFFGRWSDLVLGLFGISIVAIRSPRRRVAGVWSLLIFCTSSECFEDRLLLSRRMPVIRLEKSGNSVTAFPFTRIIPCYRSA
jgi:hypothetical protein